MRNYKFTAEYALPYSHNISIEIPYLDANTTTLDVLKYINSLSPANTTPECIEITKFYTNNQGIITIPGPVVEALTMLQQHSDIIAYGCLLGNTSHKHPRNMYKVLPLGNAVYKNLIPSTLTILPNKNTLMKDYVKLCFKHNQELDIRVSNFLDDYNQSIIDNCKKSITDYERAGAFVKDLYVGIRGLNSLNNVFISNPKWYLEAISTFKARQMTPKGKITEEQKLELSKYALAYDVEVQSIYYSITPVKATTKNGINLGYAECPELVLAPDEKEIFPWRFIERDKAKRAMLHYEPSPIPQVLRDQAVPKLLECPGVYAEAYQVLQWHKEHQLLAPGYAICDLCNEPYNVEQGCIQMGSEYDLEPNYHILPVWDLPVSEQTVEYLYTMEDEDLIELSRTAHQYKVMGFTYAEAKKALLKK